MAMARYRVFHHMLAIRCAMRMLAKKPQALCTNLLAGCVVQHAVLTWAGCSGTGVRLWGGDGAPGQRATPSCYLSTRSNCACMRCAGVCGARSWR
eukprot:3703842-Rhodomonas_salina.2